MTSIRLWLFVVPGAVLSAGAAEAQLPFGGKMGSTGPAFLVENEGVQKELKLNEDQVAKCRALNQQVRDRHKEEFDKLKDTKPQERAEVMKDLMRRLNEEGLKEMEAVLRPEQVQRLRQIDLQQRGPQAFQDPAVEKALHLTDDQKEQVKTLNDDAAKEMRELFQGAGAGKSVDLGKKMMIIRQETLERIESVLTDKQRQEWKTLTGKPFDLKVSGPSDRGGKTP